MKKLITGLFMALLFCASVSWAAEPQKNEAQVRLELIKLLKTDGYLSDKLAAEATGKYVDVKALAAPVPVTDASIATTASVKQSDPGFWERYMSWTSVIKVAAILLILVAAWGTISNIIRRLWHILVKVPPFAYQVPMLSLTVLATLQPALFWASQEFYVCFLASILNLMLLFWCAISYPKMAEKILSLFRLGIPVSCVMSFWLMVYFGALALNHHSSLFGFAAAVSFSSMLTFGLAYRPGVLTLDFNERAIPALIFGHILALAAYSAGLWFNVLPEQAKLFTAGGQVYWTIALGVGFLVSCSPWYRTTNKGVYIACFILVLIGTSFGYQMMDLKAIGSIMYVFAVLLALEWIGYIGFQGGLIVFCSVMGACLYGVSMLMERFGAQLITQLL